MAGHDARDDWECHGLFDPDDLVYDCEKCCGGEHSECRFSKWVGLTRDEIMAVDETAP